MPVFTKRRGRCISAAMIMGSAGVLAVGVATGSATASPVVDFDISVTGGTASPENFGWTQVGIPTAMPGVFNYQQTGSPHPGGINGFNNEWAISVWNFNADGDPTGTGGSTGAKIGSVFTVKNNLAEGAPGANNLHFSILVSMPVLPAATATQFFGSGAFTINSPSGSSGGALTANGAPIWNYMLDGADVASLFNTGYSLPVAAGLTNQDSANLTAGQTSGLIGSVPTELGIRLEFDLSPGETATFNGVFGFIPAPGALALLGLAGLVGRGRRRN